MTRYAVHYQGLNKRETYDEILGYLEAGGGAGIDIPFPNRTASFIRASPQYQNLLTYDFVDLQKQQENVLKQQKRDIIVKEQASDSSVKSIVASTPDKVSAATQELEEDLTMVSAASGRSQDNWAEMDDKVDQMERAEQAKRGRQAMYSRIAEVTQQHEYLGGLRDEFSAAQATGTEDYSGALGHKGLEKHISERQKSDQLRVLPPGTKNPPKYITELTKDPVALEAQRQHLGLHDPSSQEASSSAAARSKSRGRSQSRNPQDPKSKPGPKINPDSARQKSKAKKEAKARSASVSQDMQDV